MESPATQGTAMMLLVPVTLKAFINMQYVSEPGFQQELTGLTSTLTTAADQNNWLTPLFLEADLTAQHQLADIGDKMWILLPVWLIYPGNMYGANRVTDKQVLHG